MRKIDREHEHPIDNLNIEFADAISEPMNSVGATANDLTAISLVLGLISLYMLSQRRIMWFALFFYTSYLFDCCDGFYARKYGHVSKFGDAFDHVKDLTITAGIFAILYSTFVCTSSVWVVVGIVMGLNLLLSSTFLGCQEQLYALRDDGVKRANATLSQCMKLCPLRSDTHDHASIIQWRLERLRYFGCATLTLCTILCVWYIDSYSQASGECTISPN